MEKVGRERVVPIHGRWGILAFRFPQRHEEEIDIVVLDVMDSCLCAVGAFWSVFPEGGEDLGERVTAMYV